MSRMQMIGLGLVGVGLVVLFLSDDSGYFGAAVEISDGEEGPTVRIAMKTQLGESVESDHSIPVSPLGELPAPEDP
jgi:hypothetical protein